MVAKEAVEDLCIPGLYAVYTRSEILGGNLAPNDLTRHLVNGWHPRLSGDLIILDDQMHLFTTGPTTSHGTPFAYDTHVPLLMSGWGIAPGTHAEPVTPADIAPTLCALLGIEFPSACDGKILAPALRGGR